MTERALYLIGELALRLAEADSEKLDLEGAVAELTKERAAFRREAAWLRGAIDKHMSWLKSANEHHEPTRFAAWDNLFDLLEKSDELGFLDGTEGQTVDEVVERAR